MISPAPLTRPAPPALADASAAARSERLIAIVATVARLVALLQVMPALMSTSTMPSPLLWLHVLVAAETAFFAAVCLARGRFDPWLAAVDAAVTGAALWPAGWLAATLTDGPGGYVASPFYNYAAVATVVLGLARWPLPIALAAGATLTASSLANALSTDHPAPLWNAIPDAVPFVGATLLSWLVARVLRDTATYIDRERTAAACRAEALAWERGRGVRTPPAKTLSTLDSVSERSRPDPGPLDTVRAEVASLRAAPHAAAPARVVAWLDERVAGPDRMVLVVGIAARLAGLAQLAYAVPLVWNQFARPWTAGVLAIFLAVESAVVLALWLRQRTVGGVTYALDLPAGVLALVAGAWIARESQFLGFTYFAYPYTVVLGLALGLASRRLATVVSAALVLACAYAGSAIFILGQSPATAWTVVVSYLADPLIGWTCATLIRRMTNQLEAARSEALASRTHGYQARLAAGDTGQTGDTSDDLGAVLAAVARVSDQAGLPTHVDDAKWRSGDAARLNARQREALIDAVDGVLSALTGRADSATLRVEPDSNGVLVTVQALGPARAPDVCQIARAERRLCDVGGSLDIAVVPCVRLRVPTAPHAALEL